MKIKHLIIFGAGIAVAVAGSVFASTWTNIQTDGSGNLFAPANFNASGTISQNGVPVGGVAGNGTSSLALWNASGTLTTYGSAACPNGYVYIINVNGSVSCSLITIPGDLAATTVTSTWLLTSNGSNWVAAAPPSGGSGGGVASTTPFTANAPVIVSSSGALATIPNNPVPFYTYGVQYSQTTAAPNGASSSLSLWGPFYWSAVAQCSSLTYDIGTGGGATSSIDFGIYDINGNLVANTGSQTGQKTGVKNYSFTQGRKIIYPGDYFVGTGVTHTAIRFGAWAANYGWMQAGVGSSVTNSSATLPTTTTFPASSTTNTTVIPSFSCSY